MLSYIIPRLLRLWSVHLLFAVLSIPVSGIIQFAQSAFSPQRAEQVALLLGALLTVAYFLVLVRVAMKTVRSPLEALLTGIMAALPYAAIILAAMVYISRVPYNSIGYNFILLPVTFPFISWMNQVFPRLPFHTLAFSVPLINVLAVLYGSFIGKN